VIWRKQPEVARAERRQLEEIAHLYLPAAAPRPAAVPRIEPAPAANETPRGAGDRPFLVALVAAGDAVLPAIGCLFNLAVLLEIAEGPVLVAASGDAFGERFSFRFRPDRERSFPADPSAWPGVIRGPMDIRMTAAAVLGRASPGDLRGLRAPGEAPPGRGVRYLLTDDLSVVALAGSLPALVLFVVSPQTPENAFQEICAGSAGRFCARTGCAGIVTAGVAEGFGEGRLLARWREHLAGCLPGGVAPEAMGCWPQPSWGGPGEISMGAGLLVLEEPGSPGARRLMEMAARIRKRRNTQKDGCLANIAGDTSAGR